MIDPRIKDQVDEFFAWCFAESVDPFADDFDPAVLPPHLLEGYRTLMQVVRLWHGGD